MTNKELFEKTFNIPSTMIRTMSLKNFYKWEDMEVGMTAEWKIISAVDLDNELYQCTNCESICTKKLNYCPCCGILIE